MPIQLPYTYMACYPTNKEKAGNCSLSFQSCGQGGNRRFTDLLAIVSGQGEVFCLAQPALKTASLHFLRESRSQDMSSVSKILQPSGVFQSRLLLLCSRSSRNRLVFWIHFNLASGQRTQTALVTLVNDLCQEHCQFSCICWKLINLSLLLSHSLPMKGGAPC